MGEIVESLGVSIDKVIDHIAQAVWYGLARMIYVPSDNGILSLSEGASSMILGRGNPLGLSKDTIRMLALADGRTSEHN